MSTKPLEVAAPWGVLAVHLSRFGLVLGYWVGLIAHVAGLFQHQATLWWLMTGSLVCIGGGGLCQWWAKRRGEPKVHEQPVLDPKGWKVKRRRPRPDPVPPRPRAPGAPIPSSSWTGRETPAGARTYRLGRFRAVGGAGAWTLLWGSWCWIIVGKCWIVEAGRLKFRRVGRLWAWGGGPKFARRFVCVLCEDEPEPCPACRRAMEAA